MLRQSTRSEIVSQSEIRSMTRECVRLGGINLAQGVCDLEVPPAVIRGAEEAMSLGINTYTPCEGLPELRRAVADKMKRLYSMEVMDQEVVVSIGATGAFYATCLALLNPGDEVIVPEPYYGYHVATLAALGCTVKFLPLAPPDWTITAEALEGTVTSQTRAIILNTPANPSGKVFSRTELEMISQWAETHDLAVFSDEIYEHFVYDRAVHLPPATIGNLRDRTITISGFSKVFSITGWRLGYAICPPQVARNAAHFNDLVYVCAPAPLQMGAAKGLLELGPEYYQRISQEHEEKRDLFCTALAAAGMTPHRPQGAYYVLADISNIPGGDDRQRVMHILKKTGVAAVPGRAFFHGNGGRDLARFCFAKKPEVLAEACERLQRLRN